MRPKGGPRTQRPHRGKSIHALLFSRTAGATRIEARSPRSVGYAGCHVTRTQSERRFAMHISTKLGLAALLAAALLASAISTASARNLSVSEQSFRATWTSIEFSVTGATVRCRTTLEGSFHTRTIAKSAARPLIGAISRVVVGHACTIGEEWVDNGTEAEPLGTAPESLPGHLTYESFAGRLPDIAELNLLLSRFTFILEVRILGLTCIGRYGNATDNIILHAIREGGAGISALRPDATRNRFTLVEQLGPNAVCPGTATLAGTGTLVTLSTGSRLSVTLI